ncbi:MAG: response regulator transcription factor [Treponema sp.]|nr:response regulator transcription factor [Treponema sp.]
MSRILVVDDEDDIRNLVVRYANHDGHETVEAKNGQEAVILCAEQNFDLVIMDVMMPVMGGFEACTEIRKTKDVPFLMLSARGSERDKLEGFSSGVDDYVVKPFSPKELMARVNVIIGRHKIQKKESASADSMLELGGVKIDTLGRSVVVDGGTLDLTAKEYDILLYLSQNRGVALTRDRIMDAVWGENYYGDSRTVDWQIKLLRGKLGSCRDYIVTLRGVGYKFEVK